jgi:site-specific DNA-cytosine methylase
MRRIYLLELFSGSGSVGRVVKKRYGKIFDVRVHSVDIAPRYNPTTAIDLINWDYKTDIKHFLHDRRTKDFVFVWASPPCTEYSYAKTIGERDFKTADSLVKRTVHIIKYVKPNAWFIENPVGWLRKRRFMKPMEKYMHICTYCKYGRPYRKPTNIWTNVKVDLKYCDRETPCKIYKTQKRHNISAQAGVSSRGVPGAGSRQNVYPIPSKLVADLFDAAL